MNLINWDCTYSHLFDHPSLEPTCTDVASTEHLITLCCYEDFQHKTLSNLLRKQMLATSFRITFVALTCLTSTNFWWPWEPLEDNHNSGDTCQQIHQYVALHSSDYSTCLCSAYKWALTHAIQCSNTMTISATIHENSSWLTCSSWRSIAYLPCKWYNHEKNFQAFMTHQT